ncbi:MAG: O-antigen ligase family protein [Humibacillus sp.]|nr:O-antigen ligase family protein [Humibacillus sp.]MDN5775307.1 O-antigen ligase family protein [Humibacillus sp.]
MTTTLADPGPSTERHGVMDHPVASPALRRVLAVAIAGMPLLVPTAPGNVSPADLPILLAVIGVSSWLIRHRIRLRLPYSAGVWLLMTAGAISALATIEVHSTTVIAQDAFLLLWSGVIATALRVDPSLVRVVCAAWCWSGIGWASLLVIGRLAGISWLAGQTLADGSRASLTFGDPNLAGNYFVACLFIVLASRHPRSRTLRTLGIVIIVLAIVFTGSNGAALGTVAGLAVGAVVAVRRSRGPLAALGLVVLVLLAVGVVDRTVNLAAVQEAAASSGPVLHDSIGRSDSSSEEREALFAEGKQLFWTHNLIGVGPSRTKPTLADIPAPYVKEAHDDYVATLVERGVLGGVGLIILLATIATRLGRVAGVRGRAGPVGRAARAAQIAAPQYLVCLGVAFLVSGMFYEVLHFRHLWAYLGLVAGLDLIQQRAEHEPSTTIEGS